MVISAPRQSVSLPARPLRARQPDRALPQDHKPRSKLLLLDAKDAFTKQQSISQPRGQRSIQACSSGCRCPSGEQVRVDTATRTVRTAFDRHQARVANIIPPQRAEPYRRAGRRRRRHGLVSRRMRRPLSRSARRHPSHWRRDHRQPDAQIGFQRQYAGQGLRRGSCGPAARCPAPEPVLMNTCYSLVAPDYGISIAGVYRVVEEKITAVEGSEGVSPLDAPDEIRSLEAAYAQSLYSNITADVFA